MTRQSDRCRDCGGFTLMEVLLVLAILVILFSTAVGVYTNVRASSYISSAKVQVRAIEQAAERYNATAGEYPSMIEDLSVQPTHLSPTKWAGPHIQEIPVDPWGNAYQYAYPGTNQTQDKPDVWSWGPDRQSGTEDDVGNWIMEE